MTGEGFFGNTDPVKNELDKAALMPVLDELAARCGQDGTPLLTVLVRNSDDTVDLRVFRRHYLLCYGIDLGTDPTELALQAEIETQKVWDWKSKREGSK